MKVLLIFQKQNKNYIRSMQTKKKRRNTSAITQNLFSLLHTSLNFSCHVGSVFYKQKAKCV